MEKKLQWALTHALPFSFLLLINWEPRQCRLFCSVQLRCTFSIFFPHKLLETQSSGRDEKSIQQATVWHLYSTNRQTDGGFASLLWVNGVLLKSMHICWLWRLLVQNFRLYILPDNHMFDYLCVKRVFLWTNQGKDQQKGLLPQARRPNTSGVGLSWKRPPAVAASLTMHQPDGHFFSIISTINFQIVLPGYLIFIVKLASTVSFCSESYQQPRPRITHAPAVW